MPEFLKSMMERLKDSAGVKTVYGEPIAAHGKTIIPVARIAYGFGGGGGKKVHAGDPQEGEGGGGGMAAIPVGVFEVTAEGTRFVPLHDKRRLAGAALIGLCMGVLLARKRKRLP
jgi:uncharacterized spore protein YtfJ